MEKSVDKEKKAKAPGIRPDEQVPEVGRKILGFYFEQMMGCEAGARLGADNEALHNMRVAARRMRVALELFDPFFKKKVVKSFSSGLRNTTRSLGRVRDLDVFSGNLGLYLESLPENERLGFDAFLSHCGEKHNKARAKMIRFLDSDGYQSFTRQLSDFVNTPGKGVKRSKTIQPNQVRDLAPIMIYEQLAAARAYEQIVGNASIKEFHALRLHLKRLRYTVEFLHDALGPESKEIIRDVKTLQNHLGSLNDADVACQILNEFSDKQSTLPNHERLDMEPVFSYLAAKRDERNRLLATFPEEWKAIMRKELYEKVAKAISAI